MPKCHAMTNVNHTEINIKVVIITNYVTSSVLLKKYL